MHQLGLLGLLLIIVGEALSAFHVLPWSHYVFPLFWYGYILIVDSLNQRWWGQSFILNRRWEFLLMFPVSAFYWYLFEWYNLVIENWFYINTPQNEWLASITKFLSFATVIPALYVSIEFVGSIFPKGESTPRDLVISRHWQIGIVILGILLSVLPIIAPRYFFWSVWVGPFLLIDIINHRLRRDSILQDCAQGMYRRTLVIVTAGFLCGFFWEFWNYWAYTKWIYTVPIWDMPHIFEMPVLGFLGFGPFALETFAFWTLIWKRSNSSD